MKGIYLTQGKIALVDDEDFERVSQYKWHVTDHKSVFYAKTCIKIGKERKMIYLHRFILNASQEENVDHRDGDGLNCRRANLRLATLTQNQQNKKRQANNTSGYKGVYWDKSRKKWRVAIRTNRKTIRLGDFIDKISAALCYDKAAMKYHGEFACLNFPRKASS